ncbi:MAG TPA: rhodanese-like domain-containing protein [Methylomirabilota bacterium]|jgi:rhodanese-related sulfurtransferase|nr:rhodanese-like domain-containing protein [Methylomirabilota bacterium]
MTTATSGAERISPRALAEARRRGEQIVILDVRRREAWTSDPAHIPGAVWLPLEEAPRRARDLPRDAHLVVYCS